MAFNGRKYTLYRRQLKKGVSRYSTKISFRDAFSQSINPVFGKLGIYYLGQEVMADYAKKFFFNRDIPLGLTLEKSYIEVPEDDFGLAEIASGFNKRTLISPLHATMLTATVANRGEMMEPQIIKRIRDESGKMVYNTKFVKLGEPISKETAGTLRILMERTVTHGTSRKAFRKLRRYKAFKGVTMGAKTGTMNDSLDRYKYDWITLYALPREMRKGIALSVLAVHGEKLGIRSKDLAGLIVKYFFTR
jgi:cell division protein FtsI/penicillin-binding protein 2